MGAPPGYVGYDEGGQLTEKIRRKPYSVILLDEVEKAHPEVFNILLQVLEDGRLTDAQGRTVDFKNTVLIMTSNVGANLIERSGPIGFTVETGEDDGTVDYERMKERVLDELKRTFRPEFLNRIDDIIVFHPLGREELEQIIELMLKTLRQQLEEQGIKLDISAEAKEIIYKEGYDPLFGARPLRRAIQRLLENPLSDEILRGRFRAGDLVRVTAEEGQLKFEKEEASSLV